MDDHHAEALGAFRLFNYERIYLRPASNEQAAIVERLLSELVEFYRSDPARLEAEERDVHGADITREAVAFVGGMTDRFAQNRAIELVGWTADELPIGLD